MFWKHRAHRTSTCERIVLLQSNDNDKVPYNHDQINKLTGSLCFTLLQLHPEGPSLWLFTCQHLMKQTETKRWDLGANFILEGDYRLHKKVLQMYLKMWFSILLF